MHKKGSAFITIGLLLIAAALLLTAYNIWDDHRAEQASLEIGQVLRQQITGYDPSQPAAEEKEETIFWKVLDFVFKPFAPEKPAPEVETTEPTETTLPDETSQPVETTEAEQKQETEEDSVEIPNADKIEDQEEDEPVDPSDFPDIPDREMPTVMINGNYYIGVLDVEALELSLPVMDEWTYDKLKVAPCRFTGNVYQNNLVICAHNYPCHFSYLKTVPLGTEIKFTDMDGNVFVYEVISVETVGPNAVEQMVFGDWDLTLFTCNTGGQTRCAIRCDRIA